MKFLVDENIDRRIALRLAQEGHSVRQITLIASGSSDDEVMRLSIENQEIILTDDKDFGEMIVRNELQAFGVMLLRLEGLSGTVRSERVSVVVEEYGNRLIGTFTIVSPLSIRFRPTS